MTKAAAAIANSEIWAMVLRFSADFSLLTHRRSCEVALNLELYRSHSVLKLMIWFPEEAVISPVGWQRFGNIKAAVVSNEAVIVKVVRQIGNIAKALTLHDYESAEHGSYRITGTTNPFLMLFQYGQIQVKKQGVIKSGLRLRGKQAYVLYHFLSVDSNQPPFGWLLVQLNYTKMADCFLYFLVTKHIYKSKKALRHNDFSYFAQG